MKTVKYLFFCLMDCLSLNVAFTKDLIIGWIQILLYFAVLFVSSGLLVVYCNVHEIMAGLYGFLITLTVIVVLYGFICVVELFIKLFK